MPRSNKKKTPQNKLSAAETEPPSLFKLGPISPQSSNGAAVKLFENEKKIMITRAISSSSKHGINVTQGAPNPGTGDCAFEAIVQNINERSSFTEKFPLDINQYRRIWTTDMANRTLFTEFNIYSNKEWLEGLNEMAVPGTYERGIFGDLMVPRIACGVRKYLLIFNTNLNTPDDPIYVVNPVIFNVPPDTEVPVILAYNGSHYESLVPKTEVDVQMSIILVKAYLEGKYRYKNKDIEYLLCSNIVRNDDDNFNYNARRLISEDNGETVNMSQMPHQNESNISQEQNKTKDNEKNRKREGPPEARQGTKKKCMNRTIPDVECGNTNMNFPEDQEKIYFKYKNESNQSIIELGDGKMMCPICKAKVKNVHLHFTRNKICGGKVDMEHFSKQFESYKKNKSKLDNQERQRKWAKKEKEANTQTFNIKQAAKKEESRQRQKAIDLESFNKKHAEEVEQSRQRQKVDDLEAFKKKQAAEKEQSRQRQKEADLESFNKKHAEEVEQSRQRQKEANLESFNKKNAGEVEKSRKSQ